MIDRMNIGNAMSDSDLLRFLDQGLIDVGGDDTKLVKLQATAVELAAALKTNPGKSLPLLLEALVAAAREDNRVAVGFVACVRNVLPFMETGNEEPNLGRYSPGN